MAAEPRPGGPPCGTAWLVVAALAALLLGGCALAPPPSPPAHAPAACEPAAPPAAAVERRLAGVDGAPEHAGGYTRKALLRTQHYVAVTAHPLASRVACELLRDGASALDAAVAAQMVLNVVEPQSSGLGGGGFLLHWDAAQRRLSAWDGRETAPATARNDDLRWIDAGDRRPPRPDARSSGRSVGTPGLLHMLEAAHHEHGRRPWRELLAPATVLAEQGFDVTPRLAASIAASRDALAQDPLARRALLRDDGGVPAVGSRLANPALAATLRVVADGGATAFYRGSIAQDIVDAAADTRGGTATSGRLTRDDLAQYRSRRRDPLCQPYRRWLVCGMPPPSSGGIAVAQALGMLERFELAQLPPQAVDGDGGRPDALAVHLASEALRIAYADRDAYVADTDYVPLPGGGPATLLDADYLARRAAGIDAARSVGTAEAGRFGPLPASDAGRSAGGTTHLSIVDADGNVVVLTSSIEAAFGAYRMTRAGFLLNNQLTDFAAGPLDAQARPLANRLEAGKRPRSSMAPTLVFEPDADGQPARFVMATGSPGGAAIIHYVLKSLLAVLDWNLDAQQAASLVSFGAYNDPTTFVGGEHPALDLHDDGRADPLVAGLRARGHEVRLNAQASGLAVIVRRCDAARCVLEAGADPRREGLALGDALAQPARPRSAP